MIELNITGWNNVYGPYRFTVPFDDEKTDHEIRFADGSVSKQATAFGYETHDWNHDGDVYTQYGAWFRHEKGGADFFTPEQLLRLVADDDATVPGLNDPKAPVKKAMREHEERGNNRPSETRDRGQHKPDHARKRAVSHESEL